MPNSKLAVFKDKKVWIMIVIEMFMTFLFSVTLSMTSPLITNICAQTGWSLGQTAQLNTIVFFLMGAFAFVGSPLMDMLGTKKTALISLGLAAIGCIMALFSGESFALHYIGKFIYGCGWGIFFLVPGAVISYWIPMESRAVLQGLRATMDLLGYGAGYYIVLPIFSALNENWQATFFAFGIVFAVTFVMYLLFLPVNEEERQVLAKAKQLREERKAAKAQGRTVKGEESGIRQALRSKWIWILLVGNIGRIWTYNVYNTFLSAYLELERGMTAEAAAAYTGSMSVFGMVSGVAAGALASLTGRHKLLTWPMVALVALGGVCMLYTSDFLLILSCGLCGFGLTASQSAYTVIPAELPESNPRFYTGAVTVIYGISQMVTYLLSYPFEAMLNAGMTMQTALLVNCLPAAAGTVAMMFVMETGPKGKYQKQLAAERAAQAGAGASS